ncbi:MAG: hypothetical protein JNL98_27855 [Bryobacterales bacterium]|nr:hypothetical protein [Bryobacterales bacterium]
MLSRRHILIAAVLLSSCQNEAQRMELLPMMAGAHRRLNVENVPAEENPEEYKRLGLKRSRRAVYQVGGSKMTATVYEMGGQAVAFEMVQKWRPEPLKMAFHEGPFFVVLVSDAENRDGMSDLAKQLEQSLRK